MEQNNLPERLQNKFVKEMYGGRESVRKAEFFGKASQDLEIEQAG